MQYEIILCFSPGIRRGLNASSNWCIFLYQTLTDEVAPAFVYRNSFITNAQLIVVIAELSDVLYACRVTPVSVATRFVVL